MKKRYILMTSLAAALLLAFSACTQDEIVGGDDSLLPDGAYPLKIGNVSIVAQSSEEPWTRVAENTTDGNSSVWETGDVIGVRLDGGNSYNGGPVSYTSKGKYSLAVDGSGNVSLTPILGYEVYFRNTYDLLGVYQWDYDFNGTIDADETFYTGGVMAWYPAEDGVVQLADQSDGLAYILEGKMGSFPANRDYFRYTESIPLVFNHMLAKVRVKLDGDRASQVSKVEVFGYTSCTHGEMNYTKSTAPYRTISTEGASQGWITMHKATYGDSNTYWEANLVPGTIENNFVRLNGTTEVPLSSLTELKAGNLHTVTVTVRAYPSDATQITSSTGNISDNGNYYVTGNLASAINITGGSPHIYLYNANVTNSTGSAISITSGATPTIHVAGNNTVKFTGSSSNSSSAGVYVASGSTVTIQGNGRSDVLTAIAGGDAAGIGGCYNNQDCGSINISNVTVIARGSQYIAVSPGIGSTSTKQCGQITIDNATVHAYAEGISNTAECPAIGTGIANSLAYGTTLPTVIIRNKSEIHAHRGGRSADYIGYPYVMNVSTGAASAINPGTGGSVTNSTIYCYTGSSSTPDKTVVYDANGNGTEQSQ